jgi:hypothetical protein
MSGQDSYVQVAPDSTGKLVDMEVVGTAAGLVYRQRAVMVGDPADALQQLLTLNQQQLAVLRAILATLSGTSNSPVAEEDFTNLS